MTHKVTGRVTNRVVAEIALRTAARTLDGIDPPWDIEIYEGDPDATDGDFKARWKKPNEEELQLAIRQLKLAIRMLEFAGYEIVKKCNPSS